jgi:hypothetical protein
VKDSINSANSIIRKLDSQRSAMSPAQQVLFNEYVTQASAVASLTNDLLKTLQVDRNAIRKPSYGDSVKELYLQARGARKSLNDLIASSSPTTSVQSGD